MTEERIVSRKNPLLQQVRKLLSSRRAREEQGMFVADGTKLLEEAIRHCKGLDTVILSDGVEISTPEHVRRIRVPADVMESVSPMQTPQGALFLCRIPQSEPFCARPGVLLLDGIQDPGNLGTILRTADALEVQIVLLEGCADPYSHKTVRASMGAVFRRPPVRCAWSDASAQFRQKGIPVAVTALDRRSVDIRSVQLRKMAVVIGSEGQGVRRQLCAEADASLIIPMNPNCESLNASAAASIVLWQMTNL